MTELSAILVRTLVMWSGVRLGMIHSDLTVDKLCCEQELILVFA